MVAFDNRSNIPFKRVDVAVGCFEDGREVGGEEWVSEDRLGEMVPRAGCLGGFVREGNNKWEM
jgi:hypothetical protein